MNRFRLYACVISIALHFSLVRAQEISLSGDSWWSRVKILAADDMEGRNTGSEGYRRAAAYVAGQFEKIGLKPAGTKDYFQPVTFNVRQLREDQSSLELVQNDRTEPLSLGDDANLGLPTDVAEQVEAAAVFVGHGLVVPEMKIGDITRRLMISISPWTKSRQRSSTRWFCRLWSALRTLPNAHPGSRTAFLNDSRSDGGAFLRS